VESLISRGKKDSFVSLNVVKMKKIDKNIGKVEKFAGRVTILSVLLLIIVLGMRRYGMI
jgi:hypothetical protein